MQMLSLNAYIRRDGVPNMSTQVAIDILCSTSEEIYQVKYR